jgi:Arc/MetJ-type ribon-helix-helix transcriptional regulator
MVSMPDEMVKKLDRRAKQERRSRSELLRDALRRQLATPTPRIAKELATRSRNGKRTPRKMWTKKSLERYLLEKGLARKGCPGLDSLLGPIKRPAEMKRVLRITKRLTGLSERIIEDREDRV